jgi:hypothetical protein
LPMIPPVQIAFSINRGPTGGGLAVSPMSGTSLTTNFSMTSSGWSDPEGDLPLTYRYVIRIRADYGHMMTTVRFIDVMPRFLAEDGPRPAIPLSLGEATKHWVRPSSP